MAALDGRTVVVMGASGANNFGVGIARRLAAEGANVVVAARRAEPLQALANEIGGYAVACDATDEAQIEAVFAAARERYGSVNGAIFSAGVYTAGPIAVLDKAAIQPTLDISVIGALLFFKHAAASMPEGGSVITISSLTARLPGPMLSVYATARAGIDYAIQVAALEYAEQKVRFNSIAPGLIDTDMTSELFAVDQFVSAQLEDIPVGRMGSIDDVAEAALYLVDDNRSGFINGQVLDLAGGQHMGHLPKL